MSQRGSGRLVRKKSEHGNTAVVLRACQEGRLPMDLRNLRLRQGYPERKANEELRDAMDDPVSSFSADAAIMAPGSLSSFHWRSTQIPIFLGVLCRVVMQWLYKREQQRNPSRPQEQNKKIYSVLITVRRKKKKIHNEKEENVEEPSKEWQKESGKKFRFFISHNTLANFEAREDMGRGLR